ncbi:MAG: DUF4405 domain-containing protein [Lachnospiraceae bacterium]|nr:DUF4405 domain-containing protein [Lachnospiraceae bacterium]
MKKKHIRTVVDMAMIVLLPMLMAYSLIGEKLHEIIGTILFALFIVHHVLNRQWYKAIFNGKYTPRRIFQTVLNFLLLVFMLTQPISGILMSKYLYSSIRIAGSSATARELHLFLAYWGFVFMCLHAGTHMCAPIKKLQARGRRTLTMILIALGAISVYGGYAFVKRRLPEYMFLRSSFAFFDFGEPRIFFFLDYIAMMILSAAIGMMISVFLGRLPGKNNIRQQS